MLALDLEGRTIWIADAHGYGKRFIVRADEKLTAFLELESGGSWLPTVARNARHFPIDALPTGRS